MFPLHGEDAHPCSAQQGQPSHVLELLLIKPSNTSLASGASVPSIQTEKWRNPQKTGGAGDNSSREMLVARHSTPTSTPTNWGTLGTQCGAAAQHYTSYSLLLFLSSFH